MSTNKAGFKRLVTIRTGSVRFEAREVSALGFTPEDVKLPQSLNKRDYQSFRPLIRVNR
jgi:hypothetical protein